MKRVFRQIRNVKWELMLHMLTAALIVSAAAGFFIWFWFYVLNGMIGLFGLWLAIADAALFVVGAFEHELLITADGADDGDELPPEAAEDVDVPLKVDGFARDGDADVAEELHLGEGRVLSVRVQERVVEVGLAVADDEVLPFGAGLLRHGDAQRRQDGDEDAGEVVAERCDVASHGGGSPSMKSRG